MAEDFLNFVGSYTIKELTGEGRELRLSGRALPYRPITFEGEQRSNLTWYPGAPTATQQALGAEEMSSTVAGMWKDRFIGETIELTTPGYGSESKASVAVNGAPITQVVELAEVVDDIRRKGQEVEVTWLHIVRRGLLKRFKQTWHTFHDLEWELTFEWNGVGEDALLSALARETSLSEISQQTSAAAATLDAATNMGGDQAIDSSFNADIDSSFGKIYDATLELEAAFLIVADGVTSPLESVQRALAILDFIGGEANQTIAICYGQVDRAILSTTANRIETFSLGQCIQASVTNRAIVRAARAMRHTAARQKLAALKRAGGDLLGIHYAREGDDLRAIARLYYGSTEDWHTLRQFNHLNGSRLATGQVVLIPRVTR